MNSSAIVISLHILLATSAITSGATSSFRVRRTRLLIEGSLSSAVPNPSIDRVTSTKLCSISASGTLFLTARTTSNASRGIEDGDVEGSIEGKELGTKLGISDGFELGTLLGLRLGESLEISVGFKLGEAVSKIVRTSDALIPSIKSLMLIRFLVLSSLSESINDLPLDIGHSILGSKFSNIRVSKSSELYPKNGSSIGQVPLHSTNGIQYVSMMLLSFSFNSG